MHMFTGGLCSRWKSESISPTRDNRKHSVASHCQVATTASSPLNSSYNRLSDRSENALHGQSVVQFTNVHISMDAIKRCNMSGDTA